MISPLDLTRLKSFQAHISKENQQEFIALCDRLIEELGWRLIETKEKVPGAFLAWHPTYFKGQPIIAYGWHDKHWDVGSYMQPTHWMPLPPPPEAA